MTVIDREFIEAVASLLREYVRMQNELLSAMLHEHKLAQLDVIERALGAHLKAQDDMVSRLLERMEALFRPPASEPETGQQRLDS
jgi:hypothetical protein